MNSAVIAFGSNIRPKTNIRKAREAVSEKFAVLKESRFVKTEPYGNKNQPDFINGCVLIETYLDFNELLETLKSMEKKLGRGKSEHNSAPRTIDLDIAVYNDEIVDPDYFEREYLRQSIHEVLPGLKPARPS